MTLSLLLKVQASELEELSKKRLRKQHREQQAARDWREFSDTMEAVTTAWEGYTIQGKFGSQNACQRQVKTLGHLKGRLNDS